MQIKVSDQIARFLEEKEIKHVFGIIGAGNAHIFDSIYKHGYTELICVHHEQAACMAVQTYYRVTGKVTAAILTTGAGSTNGITGVVSAWADSIPCLIISGNENSRFMGVPDISLRMWGVQGYDSSFMVSQVTKHNDRVYEGDKTIATLEKCYKIASEGRPGPVWVDIPMNIQAAIVEDVIVKSEEKESGKTGSEFLNADVSKILAGLNSSKRPLLWLGNGIRLGNAADLVERLLEKTNSPALVSWAGIDLVDSDHPLVFGRAGTYGQRAANFIVQNCDFLICIGTRLAIPQVGYDISEFARAAKIAVVDIDAEELKKYPNRFDFPVCADAKDFITELLHQLPEALPAKSEWIETCNDFKTRYPWVTESDHPDVNGFINSYPFLEKLNQAFKPNQIVVTDMGTALLSGHQVLKMKKGQRLLTSTGLGEMGYGLPAALGASFGTNRGEVICLNCDGGIMMNLQELQTMVHHKLPIKIFIFNNDGYLMIKHTQKSLFKGYYAGTDKISGVSCPDFSKIAAAFDLPSYQIRSWDDFDQYIPSIMAHDGPLICEVFMHPEQYFYPKLSLAIQPDGSLISPPLEDLSPLLPRAEIEKNMLIGMHAKSKMIADS